jgi:hypothetical protein
MVSAGALNSLFFGVYGLSLRGLMSFRGNPEKPTYLDIYLAGCAGGVAQLVIACPIDLAKIKLQTQTGRMGTGFVNVQNTEPPKNRCLINGNLKLVY